MMFHVMDRVVFPVLIVNARPHTDAFAEVDLIVKCNKCDKRRPWKHAPGLDVAGTLAAFQDADFGPGGRNLQHGAVPRDRSLVPPWLCPCCAKAFPSEPLFIGRPPCPENWRNPTFDVLTKEQKRLQTIWLKPEGFFRGPRFGCFGPDIQCLWMEHGTNDPYALVRRMADQQLARARRAGYQDCALFEHDRAEARALLMSSSVVPDFAREVLVGGATSFRAPLEFDEVYGHRIPPHSKHFMLLAIDNGRRGWGFPARTLYAALHFVPPGQERTKLGFRQIPREKLTPWARLTNHAGAGPIRRRLIAYLVNPNLAYIKKVAARLRSAEVEMSNAEAHAGLQANEEMLMQLHNDKDYTLAMRPIKRRRDE